MNNAYPIELKAELEQNVAQHIMQTLGCSVNHCMGQGRLVSACAQHNIEMTENQTCPTAELILEEAHKNGGLEPFALLKYSVRGSYFVTIEDECTCGTGSALEAHAQWCREIPFLDFKETYIWKDVKGGFDC